MPQTQSFHSVRPLKFNADHPAWTKKSFFKIPMKQDTKAYARCSFFQLLGLFKRWSFKVGNYQHLFSGSCESKLGRDGDFLKWKISIRIKPKRFGSVSCIAESSVSEG